MTSEKKQRLSSLVVSANCSLIKSLRNGFCRHVSTAQAPPSLPIKPNSKQQNSASLKIPLHEPTSFSHPTIPPATYLDSSNGRAATEAYWRRTQQLECELNQLDKWLLAENNLRNCLNSNNMMVRSQGLAKYELLRMKDGGYLYCVNKVDRLWGRLVMQVSAPAIVPAETGSTILQVLRSMASMGVEDLGNCLLGTMPIVDISGKRVQEIKGTAVLPGSESGFMEEIMLSAVEEIEGAVLEGLKIQVGAAEKPGKVVSESQETRRCNECITLVMLVQLRDPAEDHEVVGELMIGLVEASAEISNQFQIERVHVAGVKSVGKRSGLHAGPILGKGIGSNATSQGRDVLWSVSVRGCKCKWNCTSKQYSRNPDIVFGV